MDNVGKAYKSILYPLLSLGFYFLMTKIMPKDIESFDAMKPFLRIGCHLQDVQNKKVLLIRVQELIAYIHCYFQFVCMIVMFQVMMQIESFAFDIGNLLFICFVLGFLFCIFRVYLAIYYDR